jgi:hypothetical protein
VSWSDLNAIASKLEVIRGVESEKGEEANFCNAVAEVAVSGQFLLANFPRSEACVGAEYWCSYTSLQQRCAITKICPRNSSPRTHLSPLFPPTLSPDKTLLYQHPHYPVQSTSSPPSPATFNLHRATSPPLPASHRWTRPSTPSLPA